MSGEGKGYQNQFADLSRRVFVAVEYSAMMTTCFDFLAASGINASVVPDLGRIPGHSNGL
jgi:hypothetical protein